MTEHAYVNVLTRGDLSSLRWIASPLCHFVSSNSNVQLCRVYYSSLNFRDIMLATGKLPPDAIPGREALESKQKELLLIWLLQYKDSNQLHLVVTILVVDYSNMKKRAAKLFIKQPHLDN